MSVEEINFERAREIVNARPDILQSADGPNLTLEEQVVRLQLQVILHLVEAWQLDTLDTNFLIGAELPPD
jgi:hypothetical protein